MNEADDFSQWHRGRRAVTPLRGGALTIRFSFVTHINKGQHVNEKIGKKVPRNSCNVSIPGSDWSNVCDNNMLFVFLNNKHIYTEKKKEQCIKKTFWKYVICASVTPFLLWLSLTHSSPSLSILLMWVPVYVRSSDAELDRLVEQALQKLLEVHCQGYNLEKIREKE